jgi:hypothetical protein
MWGLFVAIGGFIAGLFQGGIDAIVTFLAWAVAALQAGAVLLWNGLKAAVELTRVGFIKAWDFLKPLYTDVLKPAWEKFWTWFDKLRTWLNNTFGPLLKWLRDLRAELLKFWATYVRPWLDLIDVTRRILSTLASLGLAWAKKLDQELGALEQAIEAPFRYVLGKLNEIINVVNLVVTADGLFQRVALIRSLARDYQYAWKAVTQPYIDAAPSTAPGDTSSLDSPKTLPAIVADTVAYLQGDDSTIASQVDEAAAQFAIYLSS